MITFPSRHIWLVSDNFCDFFWYKFYCVKTFEWYRSILFSIISSKKSDSMKLFFILLVSYHFTMCNFLLSCHKIQKLCCFSQQLHSSCKNNKRCNLVWLLIFGIMIERAGDLSWCFMPFCSNLSCWGIWLLLIIWWIFCL